MSKTEKTAEIGDNNPPEPIDDPFAEMRDHVIDALASEPIADPFADTLEPIDPVDAATAPFADVIEESTNWLDGAKVENKAQHDEVDALLKQIRKAGTEIGVAEKAYVGPRHKAWQDAKAKFAPTIKDIKDIKTGLALLMTDFKLKLAQEQEEAQKLANIEAKKKADAAKEAAETVDETDIESVRAAAAVIQEAKDAKKAASAAKKDQVTGLRTVHKFEVENLGALVNWIAKNDKAAMGAFAHEYAAKHHKDEPIDGVRSWSEKEAY